MNTIWSVAKIRVSWLSGMMLWVSCRLKDISRESGKKIGFFRLLLKVIILLTNLEKRMI